jgi:hypothetical protein
MKDYEIIDRLRRLKRLLTYTSLFAMACLFGQVLMFVFSLLMLFRANQSKFTVYSLLDNEAISVLYNGIFCVSLIVSIVLFERFAKSARILSSEFVDQIGWYNKSAEASPSGKMAVEERILLREIAENSNLPLSRGDSASLIYAIFSIFLLIVHVMFVFYATNTYRVNAG